MEAEQAAGVSPLSPPCRAPAAGLEEERGGAPWAGESGAHRRRKSAVPSEQRSSTERGEPASGTGTEGIEVGTA